MVTEVLVSGFFRLFKCSNASFHWLLSVKSSAHAASNFAGVAMICEGERGNRGKPGKNWEKVVSLVGDFLPSPFPHKS
jgi:hypothetical protein